ncbi:MAG: DoxX family membrane protein [Bdellovibrionales bacterium]|nr:DoxX family membrane protein [Bdellovibrionales bacterium]
MKRAKKISLGLLAAFFVFAGVMHFRRPEYYLTFMPPYLPQPLFLVYLSGAVEIGLGLAVLARRFRRRAAWGLIALLIAVFPANLYMYTHTLEVGEPVYGVDPKVLYARLWLQLVFIAWAYWHTRRDGAGAYPTEA